MTTQTGISSLRDYFASYAPYGSPREAMRADIEYNRDRMVSAGLDPSARGRRIYVLPQGNHQPSGGAGDDTIANAMQDAGNTHDLLTELMAYRSPVHTLD